LLVLKAPFSQSARWTVKSFKSKIRGRALLPLVILFSLSDLAAVAFMVVELAVEAAAAAVFSDTLVMVVTFLLQV
jgi:hypothetical protein